MSTKDRTKISEKVVKRGNYYFRIHSNSEKGRVVAVLMASPDEIQDVLRYGNNHAPIRGMAKTCPEDSFVPEVGAKMAMDRCLLKLEKRVNTYYRLYLKKLSRLINPKK